MSKRNCFFSVLFIHLTQKAVYVIEDDQHYSPARIAGTGDTINSVAEGDEQSACNGVARFQRADILTLTNPAILAGL